MSRERFQLSQGEFSRSYRDVLLGSSTEWEFSTSGARISPNTGYGEDVRQISNSLALSKPPGLKQITTYIPQAMLDCFMEMACSTVNNEGQIIETLAILVGYQDADGNGHGTHLVFPVQDATCSHVNDKGINGNDTVWYLQEHLKSEIEEQYVNCQFKILSWIHTHVRGTNICFSSVDLHTQHVYETYYNPHCFGLVFEVKDTNCRFDYKYDALVLSEAGKIRAQNCGQAGSSFHSQCFDKSLYCSVKENINITKDDITVINATKTKPNEGRVLRCHSYGDIIKTKVTYEECKISKDEAPDIIPDQESQLNDGEESVSVCKNCGFRGKSLLRHLSKTNLNCEEFYDVDSLRRNKKAKQNKDYHQFKRESHLQSMKQHHTENKHKILKRKKNQYKENQTKILKSKKTHYEQNRERILSNKKKHYKHRTSKKVYSQKRTLVKHEKTKHSGTKLKCEVCNKSFLRKADYIKHIKKGHSDQCDSFQCEICHKSFKQQRYLRRHMKIHAATENDRIKCPDCTATFAREDNMKKHQFYKHLDPDHCFRCAICNKIFTHEQHVLRHIRHEHEGSYQKFKCDICDEEFNEKSNLTRHMNKHAGTSKDRVKCPECPQTFSQNSDMKRHLLRMHIDPTLSYICYFCDRVFKHKKNMQSHINKVHEQKSFQCSICDKEYTDKSSLNRHIRSHTGQRYECLECPATFVRRRDLKIHEKGGEHNYSELNCEFCNETFIFKCWNDEDNHFKYHLGKRTHCVRSRLIVHSLCEKCGYMHGWCRCIPHNYPIVVDGSAEDKADLAKEPVKHYPTLPELPKAKTFAEAMSIQRKKAEKDYIKQRDELLSNNYKITLTDVLSQRLKEPEKIKKTRYQKWLEGLGYEERRSLKLEGPNDFWYEREQYEKFKKDHFEDLSQKYYSDWVEKKKNWKRNKSNK